MSIQMPATEVYALANSLRATVGTAEEVATRLDHPGDVGCPADRGRGFPRQPPHTGRALAGELQWLGDTVAAVADSWLGFDGTVLASYGRARA